MNAAYAESMRARVERLQAEKDEITGVIITSAKKTFFAGGDLNELRLRDERERQGVRRVPARRSRRSCARSRRSACPSSPRSTAPPSAAAWRSRWLPPPHRSSTTQGVSRLPRGHTSACCRAPAASTRISADARHREGLMEVLLQGTALQAGRGLELGLVDEIVRNADDARSRPRKRWITANPESVSSLGRDTGYRIPGGTPSTPSFAANAAGLPGQPAQAAQGREHAGPAPHHVRRRSRARRSTSTHALEIEGRYFIELGTGQVAKNMIQAFWFDLNRVNGDRGRAPDGFEPYRPARSWSSAPG